MIDIVVSLAMLGFVISDHRSGGKPSWWFIYTLCVMLIVSTVVHYAHH